MKLWATIKKDWLILSRDRMGLGLMFGMPVLLVLVVTAIQHNALQPNSGKKLGVYINNADTGRLSRELVITIGKMGLFSLQEIPGMAGRADLPELMRKGNNVLTILIPAGFSAELNTKAKNIAGKALHSFGLEGDTAARRESATGAVQTLDLIYAPTVDPGLKASITGGLRGALQSVQSREVLKLLYFGINEKELPDSLEKELLGDRAAIREITSGRAGAIQMNATQHNVPAWTIFAMFFVVMSLGGSIVREKVSGSFIRLKTLPTNFMIALLSKQITYLAVTFLQTIVIFAMGLWLFPLIGLPGLRLPGDLLGLVLVTLLCGWCAVSYAILVGVFARTQEQANGFGAASVVILSIIGGLMVPAFIMPASFQTAMRLSPLHWALESYYGLFLEGGKLNEILTNIVPLLVITLLIQLVIFAGLKTKKLI